MQIESFGLSDVGRKRKNNEDVFATMDELHFYALADGMGGHQAGEVAAQLAVESICNSFLDDDRLKLQLPSYALMERLSLAIEQANHHVYRMAGMKEEWAGMGTTLSCLFFHDDMLFFGHVGDSRIYRCNTHLKQLTQDHTSRCTKKKGKITRAIGTSASMHPEIGIIEPSYDDLYLICSDGLTDHLSDDEIFHLIQTHRNSPRLLCQYLVDAANNKGGHDNITVVAIKVSQPELLR